MLNPNWIKKLEEAKIIKGKEIVFNASDIPKILGKSFESPKEFIENKIQGITPPQTDLMRAGNLMENFIINYVIQDKKLLKYDEKNWQKYEKRLVDSVHGYDVYVGGRPDAFALRINVLEDGTIVEDHIVIETKYMPSYKRTNINDIPHWYIDQIYAYMYIFKKHAIFGALLSDYPLIIEKNLNHEIDNINNFLDQILVAADKVLTGKILNEDTKITSNQKTFLTKTITNPNPNNELEKCIKEIAEIYEKNKSIFEYYKQQTKRIEQLKKRIKQLSDSEIEYTYGDITIRILDKTFSKINKDKIIQEFGEDVYNKIVEEITYKEIRIISQKDDLDLF